MDKYFLEKADELLRTFTLEELFELNGTDETEILAFLLERGLIAERGFS